MGVIGIMLTMLIPSLRRSLDVAASAVCKHNLRSLGQSIMLYRVENDGWLPVNQDTLVPSALASSDDTKPEPTEAWFLKLYPVYMQDPFVLTCPSDPYSYRMEKFSQDNADPDAADYPSYGINSFIMTAGSGSLANLDRQRPTRPGDIILSADLGPDETGGTYASTKSPGAAGAGANQESGASNKKKNRIGGRSDFSFNGPRRNSSLLSWDDGYDPLASDMAGPWITARHGDGVNILTLTGDVRKARTKNLIGEKIRYHYIRCRAGGCTLCAMYAENRIYHYTFWQDRLFWWTGPIILNNDVGK